MVLLSTGKCPDSLPLDYYIAGKFDDNTLEQCQSFF